MSSLFYMTRTEYTDLIRSAVTAYFDGGRGTPSKRLSSFLWHLSIHPRSTLAAAIRAAIEAEKAAGRVPAR